MSFQSFHETWFEQLRQVVHELGQTPRPATSAEQHHLHQQLVQKVMSHCHDYYRVKSIAAKRDILGVFTAPWATSLERSLHWIGGWRPTTVFHLIYTESSILFESHIMDILRGLRNGDLGDLTPSQLRRDGGSDIIGMMSGNLDAKMEKLAEILEKADELRMKTITNLVELLTPQQAVEFLIAAAQLMFGIRRWGINHDRRRENNVTVI
nr:transcription factor TGA1-like [Ipomoea batatas]